MFDSLVILPVCHLKVWAVLLHHWKCVMLDHERPRNTLQPLFSLPISPRTSLWELCAGPCHIKQSSKKCILCHEITAQEKWGEPKTKRKLSSQKKVVLLFTFEENYGGRKGKDVFLAKLSSFTQKNYRHLCSVNNNVKQANKTMDGRDHITMNLWKLNRGKGREEEEEVFMLIQLLPLPAQPSEHMESPPAALCLG